MTKRDELLLTAVKQLGVPYIWGGQAPAVGFDCSGFVIWLFTGCGSLPKGYDSTANGLWLQFGGKLAVSTPFPLDLAFYGAPGHVSHVMLCINDRYCLGASNGDSTCTTAEVARNRGAEVMIRRIGYRKDLVGYGTIPIVT